jgi:hypothetical protein
MEKVLDHVGIAVRSIDDALPFYLNVLNGMTDIQVIHQVLKYTLLSSELMIK